MTLNDSYKLVDNLWFDDIKWYDMMVNLVNIDCLYVMIWYNMI